IRLRHYAQRRGFGVPDFKCRSDSGTIVFSVLSNPQFEGGGWETVRTADSGHLTMHINVSVLPALAATFMLVFARIGSMVMLLPALGETNIPANIKVALAVMLTLIILPLHRADYKIDLD